MDIQISLHPSDGPRHFFLHHNKRWSYSIHEERSTIVLFDYDSKVGKLTSQQTISTLSSDFVKQFLFQPIADLFMQATAYMTASESLSIGSKGKRSFIAEEWTREIYSLSFSFYPTGIIDELSPSD